MIKNLRFKFVMINMSIVTIMLCVIFGLVFHFTRTNLEAESIRMMQGIASRPFQLEIPNTLGSDVRLPYFTIQLGLRGELVATGGGYYDLSDEDFLDNIIEVTFTSPKKFGVIEEYNLRYYRFDTPMNRYLVFSDITSERATLDNLTKTSFIIGILSFLVFLCISILLSKWAVKPVDLALKQQRQFVADASHELKTPLTVIMTNAELAQSREYDEESKQKFISSILTMSRQMRGLIEKMLQLARADNAESKEILDIVDYSKLVSNALLPFEPVFFERGLTLTAQIDNGIKVTGEEAQLHQLMDVLLDNAQKYSKEAGTTWVTLNKHVKGRCLLVVANEGESISPEEAQNIFKRFYRGDQARSRNGSFGLGLSIAESIVVRHRGKIWVESRNGINCFYVDLPCS
ncbi:sensor histidine kinase [Clostridium thermarum]|uniref:sensor histidine kinase n=1 Tax=Clostridium thermarum TaxID=1716543 RepID=UPI00111D9E5A|nr:HAMP domain-containing sensor histidine kinase [Clostridium thermarum]